MAQPIDRDLVGMADDAVSPTHDPARLGEVVLLDVGPFVVRQHATLRIVHTVGHHGIDDRGALKIVMRFPTDGGAWQMDDPKARNYVSVTSSSGCSFRGKFEAHGHARPWFKALIVQVVEGCLAAGDTVTLTLGDTAGGSPGLRLQTFCEEACELRFLVDPCATGHFVEVGTLAFAIGPDVPDVWRLVGPTRWRAGVPFRVGIRADDRWGNPTNRADAELVLTGDVAGLPQTVRHTGFGTAVEGLVAERPGIVRLTLRDPAGAVLAEGPPIRVVADDLPTFWGDLHGQSAESIGTNTAESFFLFGRDRAFLDVCAHQANDFQITNAFWARLDALSARFHVPGRFVTFPGYEWSGNTAVGGDRNVYFRSEGHAIRRSSHALLRDRSDIHTDCTTATDLFAALLSEDAVAYAHVGGRWADLSRGHDGRVERAMEIHSDWGTFEWLFEDALAMGFRVGVVANSDGHKGRPGASHPGAGTFGAYGGLTSFLTSELTRDAIFQAIRDRRTVATTGGRIDVDVRVALPGGGLRFREDPAFGPTATDAIHEARIGDIVATAAREVEVTVEVGGAAPIDTVDVLVGTEVVHRWRPPGVGRRVAVRYEGAHYRGRGREVSWDGTGALTSATIVSVVRNNAWNPDHALTRDASTLAWKAVTTGNFGGFDLVLDEAPGARLRLHTAYADLDVALADLGADGVRVDAGGLGMALSARRLPDENTVRDLTWRVPVAVSGETAIRVRVTLEDGHRAWSSPIYLLGDRPHAQ